METHRRSITKALSWRVVAVVITSAIAWWMTGNIDIAVKIGLLDTLIKLGAYYGHERMWLRIPYGKQPAPEYQI